MIVCYCYIGVFVFGFGVFGRWYLCLGCWVNVGDVYFVEVAYCCLICFGVLVVCCSVASLVVCSVVVVWCLLFVFS